MFCVPFVHRVNDAEAARWVEVINNRAEHFRLCPLAQLDATDIENARVAIVANPDPAELQHLPNLSWVQGLWAGVERLVEQTPPGINISRMKDPQLTKTMAEAVLAWTLYLHRDMPAYAAQQRARIWRQLPMVLARDRRVAIFGTGELGMAAGELLVKQGFDVRGWSRHEKPDAPFPIDVGVEGRDALLAQADIVVILLPLTDETRGLFHAGTFETMKEGASIINFGRGPIVNTADLMGALDGHLDHAVLDVFEREPLPQDDPLWVHPGVTVLPHISGPTNIDTASAIAVGHIDRYLSTGELPRFVDRATGY